MRALVLTGPGTVELREEPEPAVAGNERLVHVRSAGICGSELHGARNPGFRTPPLIMGHEFAGVTDDGDPVVINPILSCGQCRLCRTGLRQICGQRSIIGVHRPGGFAERVAVPASAVRPVPAALSLDAAALIEPAANTVRAWNRAMAATTVADPRIAVLGCGAIGLFCLLTALANGVTEVHVTDLSPARLAIARRLGAASATVKLDGDYDVIFDAAGLVRSEKRVLGSFAYCDQEFADAADLLADWDLTWASRYPLAAGARIFTELMDGAPHPVKAVLQPTEA